MVIEKYEQRLHELNEQNLAIEKEMKELQLEKNKLVQQEKLKWVGRAFKAEDKVFMIKSVPPFEKTLKTEIFVGTAFPCIILELDNYGLPFEDIVYIDDDEFGNKYKEISVKEFQDIVQDYIYYVIKKAKNAHLRQQGRKVIMYPNGEICEK